MEWSLPRGVARIGVVIAALCTPGAVSAARPVVGANPAGARAAQAPGLGAPEQMFGSAVDRARQSGPSSIAWLSVAGALAEWVPAQHLASRLASLGATGPDAVEADMAAGWLAGTLSPRATPARPPGLVRDWVVAGPFEDTRGGLEAREGPEDGAGDPSQEWDRGAIQVRLRVVPRASVTARGVPLRLMISPRAETCSYLISSLSLPTRQTLVIRVASSGAVRAMWDDKRAFSQPEVHASAIFDRAAFRVEAASGEHELTLKVCSGSISDDGFVRVHVTDEAGKALDLPWRADAAPGRRYGAALVKLERTLLGRLLETGQRPSLARALEAALARRFGGADDLRTSKVPGLLDSVVRDTRASAKELALAGWASPFGGEGSGRLQLALSRARAEGDAGTQSFVLRRLAEQRLESGFGDWAKAALASPPVSSESDTEARVLRARADASSAATRPVAVRQLAQAANAAPDVAFAWAALASWTRTLDRALWATAERRLWTVSPDADCVDHARALALSSADGAAAAAVACAEAAPIDAGEVVEAGRMLVDVGRAAEARRVYSLGEAWLPNEPAFWAGVADAWQARADGAEPMQERAIAALQRVAMLKPTDAQTSSRLSLAEGGSAAEADEPDLVDPSVFLARKQAVPAREGLQSERLLHWFRKVEVLGDRRVAQTLHYAREVVVAPRTPHELEEDLPMQDAGIEILRARVHRAGGGIAFAEEQESDGERSHVRWPELRKGDVVEVALRTVTQSPVGRRGDPPFYFVDYVGGSETAPLLYGEIVVDAPVDGQLALDVLHGEPDRREDRTENGRRMQRFSWDHPKIVADEPLSPEATELVPTVIGSTFATWKDFLDWYRAAVEGFTEPDEQIRALAAELTAGLKTRDQKLRKLFEYVADEIRYVNFVSAEAWLPNRPQQVLARRQGDCDDKAILLIALLEAAGIEATEVLLQSRYTGQPSVLLSSKAAVPLFDHGIAFLPGAGGTGGTWLDPTNPQNRLGPVPSLDARGLAVFVHHGEDRPVATPSGSQEDHGVRGEWRVTLDADGGGELSASEEHAGDDGQELRGALAEPDTRAAWVEKNLLAGWMGGVSVAPDVQFTADAGDGVAKVSYSATSRRVARHEEADLVVQVAPGMTLSGLLAPMTERTLPVVLPPDIAPGHEVRAIRITPPAGFEAGELGPGGEEDGGSFGRAKLSIERAPGTSSDVLVTRTLVLDQSVIAVDRYREWRAWLQRVDALMQRPVRFVHKPEPSAH